MKRTILCLSVLIFISCNNSNTVRNESKKDSTGTLTNGSDKKKNPASEGGCSSYYWFKDGTIAEYSVKDAKGNELYHTTSTVTNVRNEDGVLLADFTASTGTGSVTATYKCEGDKIFIDMKSFFAKNFSGMAEKGGMEMEMESAYLSFPSTMKVGDELEGANFKIIAKKDGKPFMTTATQIKDRKVESMEKITTPAGTWDCLKITETNAVKSEMMGKVYQEKETKTVYWFAPGVGVIRNDSYDKAGKLTMQSELVSLKDK